jgi:hypothetical protein
MLLFRYFPTNCVSLLIWPCSSYKKFTDDVHHHITPAFFARFYFLLLLFYLHSFVLVFVFSFLFYFNDSLLQFGLGGYCGGPTFLFFSHVKPNTAVHAVVWFIHRELHYVQNAFDAAALPHHHHHHPLGWFNITNHHHIWGSRRYN